MELLSIPNIPAYHYRQIEALYTIDLSIEEEVYNEYLHLDRSLVIADVEKMIVHAIDEFEYFELNHTDETAYAFMWHALFLLNDLKATESLPVIVQLLRQDQSLLEFYLYDGLTDWMWQILYVLGQDQLAVLSDFFKEPGIYTFVKTEISVVLQQVAVHQPERREEIGLHYLNFLNFLYDHKDDETIYDRMVATLLIEEIFAVGYKDLLPEIQKFYEDGLLNLNKKQWKIVMKDMDDYNAESASGMRRFQLRKELYEEYNIVGDEDLLDEEEDDLDDDDVEDNTNQEEKLEEVEKVKETEFFYQSDVPYVKTEPDVGRNDPCPCGSGKKFKKCHGNT